MQLEGGTHDAVREKRKTEEKMIAALIKAKLKQMIREKKYYRIRRENKCKMKNVLTRRKKTKYRKKLYTPNK